MAMVGVVAGSLYRRTHSLSHRLVLGRRPLGVILHSSNEPGELSQWLCHDDSTIKIVVINIIIKLNPSKVIFVTCNLNWRLHAVYVGKPSERTSYFWTVWIFKNRIRTDFWFSTQPYCYVHRCGNQWNQSKWSVDDADQTITWRFSQLPKEKSPTTAAALWQTVIRFGKNLIWQIPECGQILWAEHSRLEFNVKSIPAHLYNISLPTNWCTGAVCMTPS